MSIIDLQLVDIEISTLSEAHPIVPGEQLRRQTARLKLNYQGQRYDLVQAFASHKLELVQKRLHQLIVRANNAANPPVPERYLMVREIGYYSLWTLDSNLDLTNLADSKCGLALQQASIWLFQELWLQWQDLLGTNQLQVFAENLLAVNSQLQSAADLDRLLSLDPLATARLGEWSELDLIAFDRQLYQLTQKKVGQKFGTSLTIDIIESMPDSLRSTLVNILGI
jgi:hypothetical protein